MAFIGYVTQVGSNEVKTVSTKSCEYNSNFYDCEHEMKFVRRKGLKLHHVGPRQVTGITLVTSYTPCRHPRRLKK